MRWRNYPRVYKLQKTKLINVECFLRHVPLNLLWKFLTSSFIHLPVPLHPIAVGGKQRQWWCSHLKDKPPQGSERSGGFAEGPNALGAWDGTKALGTLAANRPCDEAVNERSSHPQKTKQNINQSLHVNKPEPLFFNSLCRNFGDLKPKIESNLPGMLWGEMTYFSLYFSG